MRDEGEDDEKQEGWGEAGYAANANKMWESAFYEGKKHLLVKSSMLNFPLTIFPFYRVQQKLWSQQKRQFDLSVFLKVEFKYVGNEHISFFSLEMCQVKCKESFLSKKRSNVEDRAASC